MCFETTLLSTFYLNGFSDLLGTFHETMHIATPPPFVLSNGLNQPLCRYHSVTVIIKTSTYQVILSGPLRLLAYSNMKVLNRQCHAGRLSVFPEAPGDSAAATATGHTLRPQFRGFVPRSWIYLEDPAAMPETLHSAIH